MEKSKLAQIICSLSLSVTTLIAAENKTIDYPIPSWDSYSNIVQKIPFWEKENKKVLYQLPLNVENSLYFPNKKEENVMGLLRVEYGARRFNNLSKTLTNYVYVTPSRGFYITEPNDLKDKQIFNRIRDEYPKYGQLQSIGLENAGIGKKSEVFHPGDTLRDSIIEQKLGVINQLNVTQNPLFENYPGRIVSRLYAVNDDALKGKSLGYLIDIFSSPANKDGRTLIQKVKRFFPENKDFNNIPEYIYTLSTLVSSGSKTRDKIIELMNSGNMNKTTVLLPTEIENPIIYTDFVVDEMLNWTNAGIFKRFDQPLIIQGFNE